MGLIKGRIIALDLELKNLKVLENFLLDTASQREEIASGFIGEGELINFIEDLEDAGNEWGAQVRVESAAFSDGGEAGSVPSFRLQASGSFQSLFRLMRVLENMPYEIDFQDLSLTKSSGDGKDSWTGVFIIKLLSYES
jgi:hypothetical protein